MKKAKLIAAVILIVLVIIVIAQNIGPVNTTLLFVDISMPQALLLVITLLIGFGIGVVGGRKIISWIRKS